MGIFMKNFLRGVVLLLLVFVVPSTFAGGKGHKFGLRSADEDLDTGAGVIWAAQNSYGDGLLLQTGSDDSLKSAFDYVSNEGRSIDIDINHETSEWLVTDSVDTLSFQRYGDGWVMERKKAGFSGRDRAYFGSDGVELRRELGLQAQVGDGFAAALRSLKSFIDGGGVVSSSSSQMLMASCRSAMVLGGLATIGESIGYGLSWFAGPVAGIAATPVYILAVRGTNEWVLAQCVRR